MKQELSTTIVGTQAADILVRAVQERPQAHIGSQSDKAAFSARLVSLSRNGLYVYPLDVTAASAIVSVGRSLLVQFPWRQAVYRFESVVLEVIDIERSEFFLDPPVTLNRIQRRDSFRVSPSSLLPARVLSLDWRYSRGVFGVSIDNLSLSGACLRMPGKPPYALRDPIGEMRILLGDFGQIAVSASVKRIQQLAPALWEMGLRFRSMSIPARKTLGDYILARQREEIRRNR